jgi:hypothetical protein
MAKSAVAQTSLKPFTSLGRDELPYYRIMAGELEEALGTLRDFLARELERTCSKSSLSSNTMPSRSLSRRNSCGGSTRPQ